MGEVPRTVAPSVKVIVPVTPVGTDAVKVTAWLAADGLTDDVSVTVGVDLLTVTVVAGEVAGVLLVSPGVEAVMGLLPTGSVVMVIVAVPPITGAVPMGSE